MGRVTKKVDKVSRRDYNKALILWADDVDKIYDLTAAITKLPKKLVKECVENTIMDLRDWTKNPEMSAAYFIPEFGTFVFHLKPVIRLTWIKIRALRRLKRLGLEDTPQYARTVEQFRRMWKIKRLAIEYNKRRKLGKEFH